MANIFTQLPIPLVLICLILALCYSFILYGKNKLKNKLLIYLLFSFRFFSIFIISFFLLEPYINSLIVKKEKPIIILCLDQSESIKEKNNINDINDKFFNLKNELNKKFDVKTISLGTNTQPFDSIHFNYKSTNYEAFFKYIEDKYFNKNISSVILLSDGISNYGLEPLYCNYSFSAPLYCIALGDTNLYKDSRILNIYHNDIAFLGNYFPVEVSFLTDFCKGDELIFSVLKNDKIIHKEDFKVIEDNSLFKTKLNIKSDSIGLNKYNLNLNVLPNEKNISNNSKDFFVEVLDNKKQILLLYDKVHPDIYAICQSLKLSNSYEITSKSLADFDGDFTKYSLLISFHLNIDSPIPTWSIIGVDSKNINSSLINFEKSISFSEISAYYEDFSYFKLDQKWDEWISNLPPLNVPNGSLDILSDHQILFYQLNKKNLNNKPIFLFSQSEKNRKGFLFGEGLWRWRMHEYFINESYELFDNLILNTIQFLSLNEDKRNFRIKIPKVIYENQKFTLNAEFYNSNFQLVNDPDAEITLINQNKEIFKYIFSKNNNSYFLKINSLPKGVYTYSSEITYNDSVYFFNGIFEVLNLDVEQNNTKADHQLLFTLAKRNNGDLFYLNQIDLLLNKINNSENKIYSYSFNNITELLNKKWLFFLLLLFLSLEWFFRKRNGII